MYPGHNPVTQFSALILGCEGPVLSSEEAAFFSAAQPFGFILFARNIEHSDQVTRLTSDLRNAVGWDVPIYTDQEGGRVQRLRPPLAREWLPPLEDVTRFGANAPRAMYLRYRLIAQDLRRYGIDGNCAPMLDVARDTTHAFLRNRCYGSDLGTVVPVGLSVAQGLLAGGVLPVVKHLPGHGLAQLDSHLDLPRISEDEATLRAVDFAAFEPFAELPLGMTAHLVYDAFDGQPATISSKMMQIIRQDIGFDGFVMSDDISMEALSGTVVERSVASIAAGCDAVLHCNGDLAEMRALHEAVGGMSDAAQTRAEAALKWRTDPDPVDTAALEAEFEALLPGHGDD